MGSDLRARRGLRAFVAVTVISIGLGGTLAGVANAAPPSNITRAQRGAQWLANEIKANHGFVKSFGSADVTSTAYAGWACAVGVDKRLESGDQLPQDQDRDPDPAGVRSPAQLAGTSWRPLRTRPPALRRHGSAEQSRQPAARNPADDRCRRRPVRCPGPDLDSAFRQVSAGGTQVGQQLVRMHTSSRESTGSPSSSARTGCGLYRSNPATRAPLPIRATSPVPTRTAPDGGARTRRARAGFRAAFVTQQSLKQSSRAMAASRSSRQEPGVRPRLDRS
jgi:hypothetical protein